MKKILGLAVAVAFALTAVSAMAADQATTGAAKAPAAVEKKAEPTTVAATNPTKVTAPANTPAPVAKTETPDAKADCLKKLNKTDANDPAVVKCVNESKTNVAKATDTTKTPTAVTEKKAEGTKTEVAKPVEKKAN